MYRSPNYRTKLWISPIGHTWSEIMNPTVTWWFEGRFVGHEFVGGGGEGRGMHEPWTVGHLIVWCLRGEGGHDLYQPSGQKLFRIVTHLVVWSSELWLIWWFKVQNCDSLGGLNFGTVTHLVVWSLELWLTWWSEVRNCDSHGGLNFSTVTHLVDWSSELWLTWWSEAHSWFPLAHLPTGQF